ncbi:MAG: GFA family protein [Alphaproteobacteria bacterium]|jgi:hypothetical protein
MKIDGQCHCGAIRFEAEIEPADVVICHCTDCQTFSGSAFRVSAFTQPHTFAITAGRPTIYLKTGSSGAKRRQAFCPDCGTSIYSSDDVDPPPVFAVRVGGLRQRAELKPTKQIWCGSQRDWLNGLTTIEAFEAAAPR